ncbi:hypothetical protein KP509_06G034300 [Ceratopteris richardii]|uniref:GDSL esterase/lipase n=1 Tax=Ceratopteris richardii TaxID=49495 RepID=A0A8T2UEV3_CERRI|nr:hypothetical protein KP509_06G034300 [Ceratopteris richardii]
MRFRVLTHRPSIAARLIIFMICCVLGESLDDKHVSVSGVPCYPALFVFGDSLSDTGNGNLTGNSFFRRTTEAPYGETVPGFPFNRFSDGLLLVDFLAMRIALPYSKPYLESSANFTTGVNYAVSGSTAENASYLYTDYNITTLTNISLETEIEWHNSLISMIPRANLPDANALKRGLYVIESGGNDYISAIIKSVYSIPDIITTFVPKVIAKIKAATEDLHSKGARNFLYIGVTPLGCSPSLLAYFSQEAKDVNGCIQSFNAVSESHGTRLLELVLELRLAYPTDAQFIFLDYYSAYTYVIQRSSVYGFSNTLDACCGAGVDYPYRFNQLSFCSSSSDLCSNPNVFLNWDGLHFTHRFNSLIFNITVDSGLYLNPPNAFFCCKSPYYN